MKKQVLIFAAFSVISCSQAQDIPQSQVPSVIVNKFNSEFPKATDVEWEMEGTLYNVEFETGFDIDHEIWFDSEGKIVKHKEDISTTELPEVVNNRIKTDFEGFTIHDLERISDQGKIAYKMELKSATQQEWDVVIDAEGKIVSKIAD